MSRRNPMFDITPMVGKAEKDITTLCYLGLHQYAKENNLIGRSRPMLSDDMTPYYIKRLFFRLTVACIKQMIDSNEMQHGDRMEQVNYLNVGGYKTLRLYGLLDVEMFVVRQTKAHFRAFPLWHSAIPVEDKNHLVQDQPYHRLAAFVSQPTRALIEVGGTTFLQNLVEALRSINYNAKLHVQFDPKNRQSVKNVAIDIPLFDRAYAANRNLEVPIHIERIMNFRDEIWPWVQEANEPGARSSMLYLTSNWPSTEAVNLKLKQLQREELERRRQAQEAETQGTAEAPIEHTAHNNQLNQLRERFRIHFGDQRQGRAADFDLPDHIEAEFVEEEPAEDDEYEDIPTCIHCGEVDCECEFCEECGLNEHDCICCGECGYAECRCAELAIERATEERINENTANMTEEKRVSLQEMLQSGERIRQRRESLEALRRKVREALGG